MIEVPYSEEQQPSKPTAITHTSTNSTFSAKLEGEFLRINADVYDLNELSLSSYALEISDE